MTYYVPQQQLTTAATNHANTSVVVTPTSNASLISQQSQNHSANGKRGTPPQNHQQQSHQHPHHHHHHHQQPPLQPNHQHQHSHSNTGTPSNSYNPTAITQYTAQGVPMQIADPNGQTAAMYAIPHSMYPSMLPYAASAATGVLPHMTHQSNAVINSVVQQQQQQPIHSEHPSIITTGYNSIYTNNNQNSATPQSTPSTPLSLPLPLPHQQQKNPPLFATPPIIPNGFTPQMGSQHHQNNDYVDRRSNSTFQNNPNRKTSYSNMTINNTNKNFISQQHSYNGPRKYDPANNTQTSRLNNNNGIVLPRRNNNIEMTNKQQMTSNTSTQQINGQIIGTEIKSRGPRPKPANLDLRRNNSNRNTPSTNSTESNNSPNSITSNDQPPIYMTRGTHLTQSVEQCHQPLISTYNPAQGMYYKFGQTYFAHVSLILNLYQKRFFETLKSVFLESHLSVD